VDHLSKPKAPGRATETSWRNHHDNAQETPMTAISADYATARADLLQAQQQLAADKAAKADEKTITADQKAVTEARQAATEAQQAAREEAVREAAAREQAVREAAQVQAQQDAKSARLIAAAGGLATAMSASQLVTELTQRGVNPRDVLRSGDLLDVAA
jgi:hypothetical protein